jgi:hypothetical protein
MKLKKNKMPTFIKWYKIQKLIDHQYNTKWKKFNENLTLKKFKKKWKKQKAN